ncbi:toll/interleukin-1 receptor domain-containing protein [Shewanella sp. YLB-07]|uniref:toll/interleukin-1 receptor domain-containing protein n=1 Tax=Shewanella sp. YLB-07 TaxID=2601268 RepID=UPI00128B6BEF|nr:TIR domain-containing protein [Shewanella sp. YLB-07]MPY21290.1 TIR domain-containing protein [Shewanella sp. YLB-07]MPY22077.1 TIR domain-containing protein [Shewanella sp. YLB-07]
MKKKSTIFISYNHQDREIVDNIEVFFKDVGVELFRDIRRLEYKDSLKQYMDSAIEKDYLMVIVSSDYFKSENCLYEFNLLFDEKNKILPIVKDSETYSEIVSTKIAKFWNEKFKQIEMDIRSVDDLRMISQLEEQRIKIEKIKNNIIPIVNFIKDMNSKTYKDLSEEGFKSLLDFIKLPELYVAKTLHVINNRDNEREVLDQRDLFEIEKVLKSSCDNKTIIENSFRKAVILARYSHDNDAKVIYEKLLNMQLLDNERYVTLSNYGLLLTTIYAKSQDEKTLTYAKCIYEKLVSEFSKYKDVNSNYANFVLFHYNDYGTAKVYYEKELKINPTHVEALHGYSVLLSIRLNNPKRARELLEKALFIRPDDNKLLCNYALLLSNNIRNSLDAKTASQAYEKIIKTEKMDNRLLYAAYKNYETLLNTVIGDSKLADECKRKAFVLETQIQGL